MSREHEKGMSLIVKTITRLTVGIIFLYGVYIITHGHISPGGGFAGGVIIALAFIHLMLAYGKEEAFKKFSKAKASFFESFGAILFLGIAVTGIKAGYFFLNYIGKGEPFKLFSSGFIPLYNIAISFKVGSGVFAIFTALVLLKLETEKK